jgi:hypothetical protein
MLGKRLYKTSMLNGFRLIILAITIFFFHDFYLETFTYEKFQVLGRFKIFDVFGYHYKYPAEFMTFFFLIIIPAIYYSFIRGVKFCEKGFYFNRGLPFLNRAVLYSDIKTYKLLHPRKAITIHAHKGEVYVIADNDVGRVIAILDQHNIQGDLNQDEYVRLIMNYRKFVMIVVGFTILLFTLKKLGVFQIY